MPRMLLGAVLVAVVPLITGAASDGCGGGDVTVGTDDPEQEDQCQFSGCNNELCADEEIASDCVLTHDAACNKEFGVCGRDEAGECGWAQTPELIACLDAPRTPVAEACIINAGDTCDTDDDCTVGGCGGELCYNPALSSGATDCNCSGPAVFCGCVAGSCSWFQ